MANMATDGHGTVLTYAGLTANLLSVDGPSMSRDIIDAYHMGSTTWMEYIPAELTDPGTLSAEYEFDSSVDPRPAMTAAASELAVYFPPVGTTSGTTLSWKASAVVTEWSTGAAIGERMTANATFKLTGTVAVDTVDSDA